MTPNDVKAALNEVLANGVSLNATAYIVMILGWIVAGALGAFLGAYFGKRGETAAVRRDLDTIKENLRQTTTATEEIKADISGGLWGKQRRDELRLAAIGEFNRLTNVYVAACLVTGEPRPPMAEWLRDFNIAASTIRALFPDRAYQATRRVNAMVTPYASWDAVPVQEKKRRADTFADECQAVLAVLYGEVVPLQSS